MTSCIDTALWTLCPPVLVLPLQERASRFFISYRPAPHLSTFFLPDITYHHCTWDKIFQASPSLIAYWKRSNSEGSKGLGVSSWWQGRYDCVYVCMCHACQTIQSKNIETGVVRWVWLQWIGYKPHPPQEDWQFWFRNCLNTSLVSSLAQFGLVLWTCRSPTVSKIWQPFSTPDHIFRHWR